jgi:polysaccharide export outer membrane protein
MQQAGLRLVVCILAACALLATRAPSSRAQRVETPQQTNERLRALAATPHATPPLSDYVIGTGDLISVQVFDVPEISRELRVSQTGTIGIPLIPVRLHVSGLTEIQAERKIEEVLEANGLVSHPEVTVTVKEKKSRPITIVGAVARPMVYEADRQVRLIDVLAAAGGITGDAGDHVIITRPERDSSVDASQDPSSTEPPSIGQEDAAPAPAQGGGASQGAAPQARNASPTSGTTSPSAANSAAEPTKADSQPPDSSQTPPPIANTITVSLNEILETGDMANNIVILPGDVVTVPHAGIVYVLGAVGKPGGYTVSNDRAQLTTLKVLSLAGGLSRTAKSDRAVIVRKDSSGQQREVEVDLKKVMKFQSEDVQLRPSDILYVPNSGGKTMAYRLAELSVAVGSGVLLYRLVQ